jgi:hypothetical protein
MEQLYQLVDANRRRNAVAGNARTVVMYAPTCFKHAAAVEVGGEFPVVLVMVAPGSRAAIRKVFVRCLDTISGGFQINFVPMPGYSGADVREGASGASQFTGCIECGSADEVIDRLAWLLHPRA